MCDHTDIVADEQISQAQPITQILQQVEDGSLHGNVKGGHGLVTDEKVRATRERSCDADALLLAARQLVRIEIGMACRQSYQRKEASDLVSRGCATGPGASAADFPQSIL